MQPAEALGFAFAIQGPRLVLGAAAGAALAAAALLGHARGSDLLHRELLLFGASAFGVLGGALVTAPLGLERAWLGALPGAALGAGLMHVLLRVPRPAMVLLGVVYLGAWYAVLYGNAYADSTLDAAARARLAWWAGDVAHASWASAGAFAIAVVVLLALLALPWAAARAERRLVLEIALLGAAVGAAGPVAFAGSFGALLARYAAPEAAVRLRLVLAALSGAAGLTLADALQRVLIGGYALPLNAVTGFVALPGVYVACVRAGQRETGRKLRWLGAIEALLVLAVTAFGWYVAYRVVLVIQGFA